MKRRYGASPLHALGHLALFALAAWALLHLFGAGSRLWVAAWLLGAIVFHDFLLLPVYSGLDRVARRSGRAVNHLRVPLGLSALLLLVFLPAILGRNDANQTRFTGRDIAGYGTAWLAITVALVLGSALHHAITSRTRPRRG